MLYFGKHLLLVLLWKLQIFIELWRDTQVQASFNLGLDDWGPDYYRWRLNIGSISMCRWEVIWKYLRVHSDNFWQNRWFVRHHCKFHRGCNVQWSWMDVGTPSLFSISRLPNICARRESLLAHSVLRVVDWPIHYFERWSKAKTCFPLD